MGLWAWMLNQVFTKKFWKLVKKDGFLQTYTRGHRALMHAHSVGGYGDNAKYVGRDQFGNKYYEDFDAYHPNQRRWVEFADYKRAIGELGDRVPPGWHGWLACVYEDVPKYQAQQFVSPIYKKDHMWSPSFSKENIFLTKTTVFRTDNLDFTIERRDRYAQEWDGKSVGVRADPNEPTTVNSTRH